MDNVGSKNAESKGRSITKLNISAVVFLQSNKFRQ